MIAVCVVGGYLFSYCLNSSCGGYFLKAEASGEKSGGGWAIMWQPLWGHYSGNKSDAPGLLFSPLVVLDQIHMHSTHYMHEGDFRDWLRDLPSSMAHPRFRENLVASKLGVYEVNPNEALDVSLAALIASPERYHGRRVRVIGFVRIEFEGNAVYFHREDYDHGMLMNGLWIDVPEAHRKAKDSVNMKYCLIEGTFDAEEKGHMGANSGAITSITRLDPWSDSVKSVWKKLKERKVEVLHPRR